jgi:hypothetical protein
MSCSQNEFYRSSVFRFLEEVLILCSRACRFGQSSRDLVALRGADRMLRE